GARRASPKESPSPGKCSAISATSSRAYRSAPPSAGCPSRCKCSRSSGRKPRQGLFIRKPGNQEGKSGRPGVEHLVTSALDDQSSPGRATAISQGHEPLEGGSDQIRVGNPIAGPGVCIAGVVQHSHQVSAPSL